MLSFAHYLKEASLSRLIANCWTLDPLSWLVELLPTMNRELEAVMDTGGTLVAGPELEAGGALLLLLTRASGTARIRIAANSAVPGVKARSCSVYAVFK